MKDTRYAILTLDGSMIEAKRGLGKRAKLEGLSFKCGGCGDVLLPFTEGNKQAAHFRHKSGTGCADSESYIHWISKELFAEEYRDADSFMLQLSGDVKCDQAKEARCIKREVFSIDLKEKYPHIAVEKRDGLFIPDCMLYNDNGEKFYVEIRYTHAVSEEKQSHNVPMIEVSVQNEKSIVKHLEKKEFRSVDTDIKTYNTDMFLKGISYDCKGECHVAPKSTSFTESKVIIVKQQESTPVVREPKPVIVGTQTVQVFRPKRCFHCEGHPIHYMNVGRVLVDDEYNIEKTDTEPFKDEVTSSDDFRVAKRIYAGETNAYHCSICGTWIANNPTIKRDTYIYSDEIAIKC